MGMLLMAESPAVSAVLHAQLAAQARMMPVEGLTYTLQKKLTNSRLSMMGVLEPMFRRIGCGDEGSYMEDTRQAERPQHACAADG